MLGTAAQRPDRMDTKHEELTTMIQCRGVAHLSLRRSTAMRMMILYHVFPSELSAGDMIFKSFIPEFIRVRQDFSKDTSAEVGCYRTC